MRLLKGQVSGGISFEREAGADLFVAESSSVFAKDGSLEENTRKLRESIRRLTVL